MRRYPTLHYVTCVDYDTLLYITLLVPTNTLADLRSTNKKKCACFICGNPKYLTGSCPNKRNDHFKECVNLHNLEGASINSDDCEEYN